MHPSCCRAAVDEALIKLHMDVSAAYSHSTNSLRLPLYTGLRPVAVLAPPETPVGAAPQSTDSAPALPHLASQCQTSGGNKYSCDRTTSLPTGTKDTALAEGLFMRGLVATLLANARVRGEEQQSAARQSTCSDASSSNFQSGSGSESGWAAASLLGQCPRTLSSSLSRHNSHAAAENRPGCMHVQQTCSIGQWNELREGLHGFSALLRPGCRAADLVWWDAIQPQMAMPDPGMAR